MITLHKTWIINGQTFADGAQPSPFFAQATLTGPGAAGASNQGWGVTRGGYSVGNTAVVNESTTITGPTLCTVASSQGDRGERRNARDAGGAALHRDAVVAEQ